MTGGKSRKPTRYRPLNPLKSPRFGDVATFNRLPYLPDFHEKGGMDVDVAILGIPFDGGTTFRPGARFGPRAVRDASVLCRNYNPSLEVGVYERLNVVDGGDVSTTPINIQTTLANIEAHLSKVYQVGARSICVGGDHSVILGELRAVCKAFGDITLIHFDAHTDTGDEAWGEKYHHGTPIRRAIEEGLIKGPRIFQIGIRGPLSSPDQEEYCASQRINTLDIDAFYESSKKTAFFNKIRKTAGRGPCFLTFDVDGIDPVYAPGTGTPVVGGMTSREALEALRRLKGLRFIGGDVVEISPPYDHSELTALLGAALVFEILGLMASGQEK